MIFPPVVANAMDGVLPSTAIHTKETVEFDLRGGDDMEPYICHKSPDHGR